MRLNLPAFFASTLGYAGPSAVLADPAQRFGAVYVGLGRAATIFAKAVVQHGKRSRMRDALTGCFTRGHAIYQIERLTGERRRPFCFGMFDRDSFKIVKAGTGHLAHDRVPQQGTRVLANRMRVDDLLVRHGADEFVEESVGMDLAEAPPAVERMPAAVAGECVRPPGAAQQLSPTLSLGLGAARPAFSTGDVQLAAHRTHDRATRRRNRVCREADELDLAARTPLSTAVQPDGGPPRGGAECT